MVCWAMHAKHPNCNNGLQALARMGASVTGIEPQQHNIKAAVAHARGDAVVAARTKYLACTAEELAGTGLVSLQVCMYSSCCTRYPRAQSQVASKCFAMQVYQSMQPLTAAENA